MQGCTALALTKLDVLLYGKIPVCVAYDGVQHDYTRKQGLVWEHIFLPDFAPMEWQERSILWNAVEEAEKTKDSRLAR